MTRTFLCIQINLSGCPQYLIVEWVQNRLFLLKEENMPDKFAFLGIFL